MRYLFPVKIAKKGWDTPPIFSHGTRLKNSYGRCLTIVDCDYVIGDMCCVQDWVYRVKYDDGEYENLLQRKVKDYAVLIST